MIFQIDEFEIDTSRYELRWNGEPYPVEPQVFSLLLLLVENRHRMVPREEIVERVWNGRAVSDSAISSRVKAARKALKDDGVSQRCIRTIHSRGYRFVGRVVERVEGTPSPHAQMEGSWEQLRGVGKSHETAPLPIPDLPDPHSTIRLLERAQPLERMLERLTAGLRERGSLVFLGGEAGVGKTSLVREVARLSAGIRILWGACDPLSTPRPLGPLQDFADSLGSDVSRLLRASAPRAELFQAVLNALRGSDVSVLLVIEDVHWADEATLDLVRFLGRRLQTFPVLLVATYRSEDAGPRHPLTHLMGDLATSPGVCRERLAPLSQEAVADLARKSGIDALALFHRTGGNPFFVTEILAAGNSLVPATVRDAVLARTARLSSDARRTLEAAAILGPRVSPDLVEACSGSGLPSLDECIAAGLLVASGDALAFRHELAREAIQESLPASERKAWHASALAELVRLDTKDMALLAHHAEGAGDARAVLTYAPAAARHASSLRAHREAAAHLGRALRFASHLPADERATLLEDYSFERYLSGPIEEALQPRWAAFQLRRDASDFRRAGDNLRWMSRICWSAGNRDEAEQHAVSAIQMLELIDPGPELLMARSNLSQLCMLEARYAEAIEQSESIIAMARTLEDPGILSHALNNAGVSRAFLTEREEFSELEESLQLALHSGHEDHAARSYVNLATTMLRLGYLDKGNRWLKEGIDYCSERDLDEYRKYLLSWSAQLASWQGHWEHALALASEVLVQPGKFAATRIQCLTVIGRIQSRRGDPGAQATLDEALDLASLSGELQRMGPVRLARIEAAWLQGDRTAFAQELAAYGPDMVARSEPWLRGELAFWSQRAKLPAQIPLKPGDPWQVLLSGDGHGAARAFQELGFAYESAQALSTCNAAPSLRQAMDRFERLQAKIPAAAALERLRGLGKSRD